MMDFNKYAISDVDLNNIVSGKKKKKKYSDAEMKKITGFTWRNGRMHPTASETGRALGNAFINSIHGW